MGQGDRREHVEAVAVGETVRLSSDGGGSAGGVTLHRSWDLRLLFQEDPLGGGAVGVALYGLAAGYALSGRGRLWGRLVCGAVALTAIPLWALTVTGFGGPGLAVATPRGLWVALYYWSYLAVLGLACAIPHRAVIEVGPHGD